VQTGIYGGLVEAFLYVRDGGKKQWENSIEAVSEEVSEDREKCIKQLALNVAMNAKFRSSLQKVSRFSAENAIEKGKGFSSIWI